MCNQSKANAHSAIRGTESEIVKKAQYMGFLSSIQLPFNSKKYSCRLPLGLSRLTLRALGQRSSAFIFGSPILKKLTISISN